MIRLFIGYLHTVNLSKISTVTLCLITLITLLLGYQLQYLQFSYEAEDFFPLNSEETHFFEDFRAHFGNDDDYILIGIRHSKSIFQQAFLEEIDRLTQEIDTLKGVEKVQSISNIKELRRSSFYHKLLKIPYLHIDAPEKYAEDSSRIYSSAFLPDFLISRDGRSTLLYIENAPLMEHRNCRKLTESLEQTLEGFSFHEVHIAGRCTGQTAYINLIQKEVQVFITFAVLVIILVLWFTYRSFWGIVLPLSVVGLTVLWTVGIMIWMGKSFDLISNVIPTILMIIGVADVIHLLTHYQHLQSSHSEMFTSKALRDFRLLRQAMKEVGLATLLTTFTTSIGFLTLTTSSFKPLVELGLYSTIGLFVALVLTYTLIPALLVLLESKGIFLYRENSSEPKEDLTQTASSKMLSRLDLQGAFDWTMRHPKGILWGTFLLTVCAIIGATQIKVNNYIMEDLKKDHPQRQDFTFFEEAFGGARAFEMMVSLKDTSGGASIFDFEVLEELERVDSFLIHQYGVKNLISSVVLVKSSNQIYQHGRSEYYRLPPTPKQTELITKRLRQYAEEVELYRIVDSSQTLTHISGKVPDWGSYLVRQKNVTLEEFVANELEGSPLEYRITGSGHLIDLNNSLLAENVLLGLLIAIGMIGILFAFLLPSVRLLWLVLIPNIFPLLVIAGIMGFSGIDLKISTSIIFIIAFGIAVDDSIHFLSRFRREAQKHSVIEAVRRTYLTTGKAILVTSLILAAGFSTLCISDFLGTFYMGLLIALTLLVALLADLLLLPVLLVWFYRP